MNTLHKGDDDNDDDNNNIFFPSLSLPNRKCFILDRELSKDGFKLGSKITAVNSDFL